MSRTLHRLLTRPLLVLGALALLGGPAVAGGGKTSTARFFNDTATTETTTTTTTTTGSTSSTTSLNDYLVASTLLPTGDIDPTNIPVLTGDFASLTSSVAPEQATRLQLKDAQRLATGKGIVVAILDSGFNLASAAISSRLVCGGFDAFDWDEDCNDPGDKIDNDGDGVTDLGVGHGTFVASLVARSAPGARILPVRIADDEGRGTSMSMSSGLQYAVESGADVINVSFHLDTTSYSVQYWLSVAESKGIVVVCAAGNEGVDYLKLVAKVQTTLAVGAVDGTDRRTAFSNYGPAVDVYAPGLAVQSVYGSPTAGQLAKWSGTSFSAAFASGAAALVLQRHPDFTPAQVREVLRASVDPAFSLNGEAMYGGRINLFKAASK